MDSAGTKTYTDTNVLRYFGTAFRASPLDGDLRDQLLMSPISILELLSQLATKGGTDALSAVQAVVNVYNPSHAGLLPWPKDAFREAVFGVPATPDALTDAITKAVNRCLVATTPQELHNESSRLQDLLTKAKHETAAAFEDFLKAFKGNGPLGDDAHRSIFARSIAVRAEVPTQGVDVDKVIERLNALYVYGVDQLNTAAAAHNYNVKKHDNDFLDAEQLAYSAYPALNLLTCDKGFKRAAASPQFTRIHIVSEECLTGHARASARIRTILTPAR